MKKKIAAASVARATARAPLVESLEARKLMAAVVDIRLPGGGTQVVDPTVGQTINFQVWVTVTGANGIINDEQLQIAAGSVLSSNIGGGVASGTLSVTRTAPFNASGSQNGTQADLDGDGDLDVGSNDPSVAAGFVFARSSSMTGIGTAVTQGQAFQIATGSFVVASLRSGTQTDLLFRPRGTANGYLYQQDGQTSTTIAGAALTAGSGINILRTPSSSISGRVFDDKNANGIFDGSDTGISGFRVFLDKDFDGVLDAGETSKPVSATGTYTFSAVPAGTYRVREVFRSGWRQTFPALGYYQLTLGYGETARSLSFANTNTVLIKGRVWMDANLNRKIDVGESGLPGWTLYLDGDNDGIFDTGERSAVSDANGNYRFFNIPAGTYTVRIVQQAKFRQTAPTGGVHTITLAAGGTTSNKNFGEKRLK